MKLLVKSGTAASLVQPFSPSGKAAEIAIAEVHLNGVAKGEYVVRVTADDDFLILGRDLDVIGLRGFTGKVVPVEDRTFFH